ncbi:DUF4149 domain-containing protein [Methylophaga frappieri]|nr:DUF4149 domain-containing protein [Methylophaga frappieri]
MHYAEFAGERLLLTLWVGSIWALGYLAVPLAFASLEVQIAAAYAARLFYAVNIIGLVSGSMLILGRLFMDKQVFKRSWRFWILLLMLGLTLFFMAYLQPEMAQIKEVAGWRDDDTLLASFQTLHRISENLYLMLSVLGLILVLTADKKSAAQWHGEK